MVLFIFLPIEAALADAHGVRTALVILGVALGAVTIPLHLFGVARPPPAGPVVRSDEPVVPSHAFRYLVVASVCAAFIGSGLAVHQASYFREHGFTAKTAATAAGILGAMQLVGRFAFAPAMRRVPRAAVTTGVFGLSAGSLLLLAASDSRAVIWTYIVTYGAARGMITLLRATLVAELFGSARYGSISGAIAGYTGAAQATAPLAVGVLYDLFDGYGPLLWILSAIAVLAVVAAHPIE